MSRRSILMMAVGWLFIVSCSADPGAGSITTTGGSALASTSLVTVPDSSLSSTSTTIAEPTTSTVLSPFARPAWLGTRELPLRPDGFGEVVQTPPELAPRRLQTVDRLPPPSSEVFESTIGPVPQEVLDRSTWHEGCPVTVDDLMYITVSHFGFDGEPHTGEMIVNRAFAEQVVGVFDQLYEYGYPIEEMRVVDAAELELAPTGDDNLTTSFVCRDAVGTSKWSEHAYGLAIDVNPFQNPYVRGDLVLPELASFYTDRQIVEPGMIQPDSIAVQAFAELGWGWGGTWTTIKDWMHFSSNNR